MQAIILAGGQGTRLRPLVGDIPKPMAPVAGRPFLEYLLVQLRRAGIELITISAGYRAGDIEAHFGRGDRLGVRLEYSVEDEPLGTAGALKLAASRLAGDRWLALNGNSLLDIPLDNLGHAHTQARAILTMALAHVDDAGRYGRVELAADGAVTSFAEKNDAGRPGLINGGVYVIERRALDGVPAGSFVSLERELLPSLLGHGLRGVAYDAFFIDIGVPDDYRRAQESVGALGLAAE